MAQTQAVILAAGRGTRMKELASVLPKPMCRVQGKPILEHIVAGIVASGIRDIFIVTGWRTEVIEQHFGDGKKWSAHITFGRQPVQDGTGRAPEVAKAFVEDSPFLLTYGDIHVPPQTYAQLLQRFNKGNFAGVLTVTRGEDVTKGGEFFRRTILPEAACGKTVFGTVGTIAPGRLVQARRAAVV